MPKLLQSSLPQLRYSTHQHTLSPLVTLQTVSLLSEQLEAKVDLSLALQLRLPTGKILVGIVVEEDEEEGMKDRTICLPYSSYSCNNLLRKARYLPISLIVTNLSCSFPMKRVSYYHIREKTDGIDLQCGN